MHLLIDGSVRMGEEDAVRTIAPVYESHAPLTVISVYNMYASVYCGVIFVDSLSRPLPELKHKYKANRWAKHSWAELLQHVGSLFRRCTSVYG